MSEVIGGIMNSKSYTANNMRMMFYNGDVDTVCQFLGDQWFIENLATVRNLAVGAFWTSFPGLLGRAEFFSVKNSV